jgi:aldose 1-epimerase
MITLGRGSLELDILPEIGGSGAGLTFENRPVLRPVPHGTTNVLDTACFPLVPYANRIENGLLSFEGQDYRLPLNFGEHPHSLHGHGWQTAWRVEALSRDRCTLAFDHAADAWAWAYAAEQVFSMTDDGVVVQISLRNRSDKPMPYSLGLHPYFPRVPGSSVTAAVDGMWDSDATQIPTKRIAAETLIDLAKTQSVATAPFVDNTFTGWKGPARIAQPELGFEVELSASANARFFHVFVPQGADFFCAEPTTAMPNAFGRPESAAETGAGVLAPGATATMEMRLAVRRL